MLHVFRQLFRAPGFALIVTLFLGLSVAALLALATAGWALLAKPLPYPAGDRLFDVDAYSKQVGYGVGLPVALAERLTEFEAVEAVGYYGGGTEIDDEQGNPLHMASVSASLLRMLGARPLLGRLPAEGEADSVALISESLWEQRFNRDPGVLDQIIESPGQRLRVIGVLPRTFGFPRQTTVLWQPLVFSAAQRDANWSIPVYVRLRPSVGREAFEASINAAWSEAPELVSMRNLMGRLNLQVKPLRELWGSERADLLRGLSLASALVLLALSANLANLWLGRTLGRQRELAVRRALGAAGWRVVAPVLGEIAVLTVFGVALGLVLTPIGLELLQKLAVIDPGSPLPVRMDAMTAAVAVLGTGLLFGMLALGPLWLVRRGIGVGELAGGARTLALGAGGARLRRGLVAFQIAVAVTLLAGGGLLLKSLSALLEADLGFNGRGFVMANASPKFAGVDGANDLGQSRMAAWFDEVIALPGVRAASFASSPPLTGNGNFLSVELVGEKDKVSAGRFIVGPAYFSLIAQPLLAGRAFDPADSGADVVMVDELFARTYLAGRDPLTVSLGVPIGPDPADPDRPLYQHMRIIGVVSTQHSPGEKPTTGGVYQYRDSLMHSDLLGAYVLLKTDGAITAMEPRFRELAQAHGLRLWKVAVIDDWIRSSVSDRMPLLWLLSGFAVTCLLLCCTGLFALVQFAVRSRRGEFGLKLALGATAARLSREVLLDALRSMWPGLVLGTIGALIIGHLLASRLYQASPYDPMTLVLVALLLGAVSLAAAWWPARRAGRVAPIEVLRQE
ncbi:MAG: hypothetical protein CVV12_13000 [Gammaproteobacteria bacterium HGW-Gammaproteobacteria-2]|jgi:predicted permease|nr:MAG: hypothetical protein CVV12_13000 [Gammaproteobacteria bacterium HGW-Gammaproteobacteria-2]